MPALSTGTYGKGSPVTTTSADLADRITAALTSALDALDVLDRGVVTGAVADQGAVNTLRKVVGDLSTLANDTRKAAADEAQKIAEDKTAAAKAPVTSSTGAGTSTVTGTSTSKS
jgi:hypothetical protein